ncbi:MAG: transcriptional regulator [Desulfatitalea sp.]|nr:transcriptional regulator [Desulfatitalea sp.]
MARGEQLSRQWRIIHALIASTQGKSATELAYTLACHSRTVYRDLEALQMAGFPLFTEQVDGKTHWSLLDAPKHQMPLPLDLTELMALYFSRNMLKMLDGTALFESLSSLFEKVKSTLPPAYIDYLETLSRSLAVGPRAHKPYRRFKETLDRVNTAVQEQRHVQMDYWSMHRQAMTHRRVAPYKLWFYDETFYMIGHCDQREDVRLFAVDRIDRLEVLESRFETPRDFDAQAFMRGSFGVFQGDPVRVSIHFTRAVAGYIREKIWHPTQALTDQPDGSLIFTAEVAGLDEIKFWVLRWGAAATVFAPDALRAAVAREAKEMLAHYQNAAPDADSPAPGDPATPGAP